MTSATSWPPTGVERSWAQLAISHATTPRLDVGCGRIGVDYDVRIDTTGRLNQTVLLTLRFVFGF